MGVTDSEGLPRLGQIVRILRGREAGNFAIVIGVEKPRFVWLADGCTRKADKPKKKNVKHVQPTNCIAEEVVEALEKNRSRSQRQTEARLKPVPAPSRKRRGERRVSRCRKRM